MFWVPKIFSELARAAPVLVGVARQTLVKKVIWVGDSNLGKLEKELVIMMFCAGSLNTPQLLFPPPIPLSSLNSQNVWAIAPFSHRPWQYSRWCFLSAVYAKYFAGVEFWKVYGEYMCGNNPPGDNSFDDCRFLTFLFLRASKHYYWAPTYNINSHKMADS